MLTKFQIQGALKKCAGDGHTIFKEDAFNILPEEFINPLKEEYLSMADYRKVKDRKPDEPDVFYRPPSVRL